jgi:hypothetical protein
VIWRAGSAGILRAKQRRRDRKNEQAVQILVISDSSVSEHYLLRLGDLGCWRI